MVDRLAVLRIHRLDRSLQQLQTVIRRQLHCQSPGLVVVVCHQIPASSPNTLASGYIPRITFNIASWCSGDAMTIGNDTKYGDCTYTPHDNFLPCLPTSPSIACAIRKPPYCSAATTCSA